MDGHFAPFRTVAGGVAAVLTRHSPAAARMNAFYWRLFGGDMHAENPGRWKSQSRAATFFAVFPAEAGFWPVTRFPSTTA